MNSHEDRRHNQRIPFETPVILTSGDEHVVAKLLDISLRGAMLRMPPQWDCPDVGEHSLELKLSQEANIHMSVVLNRRQGDIAGFHCLHIDVDSISHLRRLLELNTGDDGLVAREMADPSYQPPIPPKK